MPKTFNEVQAEYDDFRLRNPDTQLDLTGYAKLRDATAGVPEREAAYDPTWLRKVGAGWERLTEATGLPFAGETAGRAFGELIGADQQVQDVLGQVGKVTPEMMTAGVLSGGTSLLPRVAGYGLAGLIGSNQIQSNKLGPQLAGAAINAGSFGLGNVLLPKAATGAFRATQEWLNRAAPKFIRPNVQAPLTESASSLIRAANPTSAYLTQAANAVPAAASAAATLGTMTGINEASRQAMLSAEGVPMMDLESWTAGPRNPLATENLIANAAGLVPMAPTMAIGFAKRPRTNIAAAEGLQNWLQERHNYVAENSSIEKLIERRGVDTAVENVKLADLQTDARLLSSQLDALRWLQSQGKDAEAESLKQNIARFMSQNRVADDGVLAGAQNLETIARSVTPSNSAEFTRFVGDLNGLINEWNGMRSTLPVVERQLEGMGYSVSEVDGKPTLRRQGVPVRVEDAPWNVQKAFEQYSTAKTMATKARDPMVLRQLQEEGYIEPVTEDWLKREFNFSFDRSIGDYEFAWRAVVQKAAGRLLDQVEPALAKRGTEAKAQTPLSPKVIQEDLAEFEYIDALNKLPEREIEIETIGPEGEQQKTLVKLRDVIALRGLEMQEAYQRAGGDFEKHGVMRSMYPNWRRVVIQAANSLTPDGKITIVRRVKQPDGTTKLVPETRPLDDLFAKGDESRYKWYPKATREFIGKESERVTRSLDDVTRKQPEFDEEYATSDEILAGRVVTPAMKELSTRTLGDMAMKQDPLTGAKPTEPSVDVPVEPVAESQPGVREAQGQRAGQLMAQMTDPEVWSKVSDLYQPVSKLGKPMRPDPATARLNGFREKHYRLAMEAALENLASGQGESVGPKGQEFARLVPEIFPDMTQKQQTPREALNFALQRFFRSGQGEGANLNARLREVMRRLGVTEEPLRSETAGYQRPGQSAETLQFVESSGIANTRRTFGQDYFDTIYSNLQREFTDYGLGGSMKDFYVEIAAALAARTDGLAAKFAELKLKDKSTAGLAERGENMTGRVGVALDPNNFRFGSSIENIIRATLHEVAHIDSYISQGLIRPDAYSEQQLRFIQNLKALGDRLTPEQRDAVIVTLEESLVPKAFRNEATLSMETARQFGVTGPDATKLRYGSQSSEEFQAKIREIVDNNIIRRAVGQDVGRGHDEWTVLDFLPQELHEYIGGYTRAIGDVVEAAQKTLETPYPRAGLQEYYKSRNIAPRARMAMYSPLTPQLGQAFRAVVESARAASRWTDGMQMKVEAQNFINANTRNGAYTPLPVRRYWTDADRRVVGPDAPLPSKNAEAAIGEADDFFFGKKDADPMLGATRGWRLFAPFFNMLHDMDRSGIPLARDVEVLARNIKAQVNNGVSLIYNPFLTHDAAGRAVLDKANPVVKRIMEQPHGLWREAFNEVSAAQNAAGAKQMFVKENGEIKLNPEMGADWARISKKLSSEDQQMVMNLSVAMDEASQMAAGLMQKGILDSISNRTALLLMSKNKSLTHDQAKQVANAFVGDVIAQQDPTGRLAGIVDPTHAVDINDFVMATTGHYFQVVEALNARKGHRTESLPYDWIVRYRNPDGEVQFLSAKSEAAAIELQNRLRGEGNKIEGVPVDRNKLGEYHHYEAPDNLLVKFIQAEEGVWKETVDKIRQKHGDAAADDMLAYTPGEVTLKELELRGIGKFLKQQEGKVDRTRYDYLEGFEHWVPRVVASVVYKNVRQQMQMILRDPRAKGYPEFQNTVRQQFDYVFSPVSEWAHEMSSLLGGYFLGGNLSSAFVEMSQSPMLLVPVLINNAKQGGVVQAWGTMWDGINDTVRFQQNFKWRDTAKRVKGRTPERWSDGAEKWTLDETLAALYDKAVSEGMIDHGVIQDIAYSRDIGALQNSSFGTGKYTKITPGRQALDMSYIGMQHLMRLYSWAALANNKISFFAGVRQAYRDGLRGRAAYEYALRIKDLAQFGGGKANTPGFVSRWSNANTRSAFTVMKTLQQYGFGMFATYMQMSKDAIGANPALTPGQKIQARKALGTLAATQMAVAGVFGLPFAAAAMTALEKIFPGLEVHKAVKEGLAQLGREVAGTWTDDPNEQSEAGARLSDFVLNGAGNQLFGIDVSSRVGVSNLFGTSAYRGFAIEDMFGPAPSVIENVIKAAGLFGQGQPIKAARELVPQAFKNTIEMADTKAKYGDYGFRDKGGTLLYQPTTPETIWYGIGFRPAKLSAKRQAQSMLLTSEQNALQRRDRTFDEAAQALSQGNSAIAHNLVRGMYEADPTVDWRSAYRSVLQRAVDMGYEKDLIARGSTNNEANRLSIAQAFGRDVVPQRSEMDYLKLRWQYAQQLGLPDLVDDRDVQKAMMIDELTRNRQMTRSQAVRLVEFMQ